MVLATPITARYGITEPVLDIKEGKNQFLPPQGIAWFGTDDIGRDVYSRLLYGIRTSLFIGLAVGDHLGVHRHRGRCVRRAARRPVRRHHDAGHRRVPGVPVPRRRDHRARVPRWARRSSTPIIGDKTSIRFIIVLFAIFGWMGVARLVRGQVLSLKEREYIEAARAVGASNLRIVVSPPAAELDRPDHGGADAVGDRCDRRRVDAVVLRVRPAAGPGLHVARQARSSCRARVPSRATGGWWCSPAGRSCCWRCASTSSVTVSATRSTPSSTAGSDHGRIGVVPRGTCASASARRTGRCRPCAASTSTSQPARRSVWWARAVRASRSRSSR